MQQSHPIEKLPIFGFQSDRQLSLLSPKMLNLSQTPNRRNMLMMLTNETSLTQFAHILF